jgi:hypothetical protein
MTDDLVANTIIYGELGLFGLIAVCIIVLIFRRVKIRRSEDFEKRDH